MRYELFLRRAAPLPDEAQQAVKEIASSEGDDSLALELFRKDDVVTGFDLGVDPNHPRAAGLLCGAAFRLAEEHGLNIYDPQLGRAVTAGDEESIRQQLEQSAAFVMAAPVSTVAEGGGLSPTLRLWLIVIGVVVLAFVVIRGMSCAAS